MILTFTPNPAFDVTVRTGSLVPGASHPVTPVARRAGGKGVNVASTLRRMGIDAIAGAVVGRTGADGFAADLDARGVGHLLIPTAGEIRRSTTVLTDDGAATVLNEPGTGWDESARAQVLRLAANAPEDAVVLTISGSLPPGVEDAVIALAQAWSDADGTVLLDLRDAPLRRLLPTGPSLVKPNRSEATATLGLPASTPSLDLADALVAAGARAAVVSDGAAGMTLVADGHAWWAGLPEPLRGNPTGAGDAAAAAFAAALQDDQPWPEALRHAVAWSAATVLSPVAGELNPADVESLSPRVRLESLDVHRDSPVEAPA